MRKIIFVLISAILAISLAYIFRHSITGLFIQQFEAPARLTVNPIYWLNLDFDLLTRTVLSNSTLDVLIKMNKTGREGEIEVKLDYKIITPRKEEINTSADVNELTVDEYSEAYTKVDVPTLRPGKYRLKITATHPQAISASEEKIFFIRKTERSLLDIILEFFGMFL